MKLKFIIFFKWIINTPYRSINRAYNLSKKIRNIHIHYMWYKYNRPAESHNIRIATYIDIILQEYASQIYWALIEFRLSKFLLHIFSFFSLKNRIEKNCKDHNLNSVNLNEKGNLLCFKSLEVHEASFNTFNKKIIWIEAVLSDLDIRKENYFFYPVRTFIPYSTKNVTSFNSNKSNKNILQILPYESVGLVPRSITRTLVRFKNELLSLSPSIVLTEFRLVKYQAIASLQYLLYLILGPWLISEVTKIFILRPIIIHYWNSNQYDIFLNSSQEEQALTRLQQIEELVWLDIILNHSSDIPLQNLSINIYQKTLEVVDLYNDRSINTVLNIFTDLMELCFLFFILIWGKKRLAILNSWIQELFYSLSDTMKAFFILLCTDLCIGFHSPHGWEILISSLLDHLALSHNPYIISCLVSTFPVILDTVFKYWIFRHLNRISPSIVVTYHTMNE
jgi:CemA family